MLSNKIQILTIKMINVVVLLQLLFLPCISLVPSPFTTFDSKVREPD